MELFLLSIGLSFSLFFLCCRVIDDRWTFGTATIDTSTYSVTSLTAGVKVIPARSTIIRDATLSKFQLGFSFTNTSAMGKTRFLMKFDITGIMAVVGFVA